MGIEPNAAFLEATEDTAFLLLGNTLEHNRSHFVYCFAVRFRPRHARRLPPQRGAGIGMLQLFLYNFGARSAIE